MKVLETERLILRRVTIDDAAFIDDLMNEPAFIENVADRGLRTIADATECVASKILPSYERFGFGFYLVELKQSGVPVGICGLIKRDTLEDVDIGFSILHRFCGHDYAFEAAAAIMTYGRNVLGLPRIVGVAAPGNQISIYLLEKLGLRFERTIYLPGYGSESMYFA